ncbi:MAG: SPFH domain-containing protein [bacterium]|nr:SPFH domain-containing protein [bacterium]
MAGFTAFIFLCLILALVLTRFIRQINQYERGVLFTMGKFSRIVEPGWFIMLPVFHLLKKVDIRTKTVDVPNQEVITKDNIPIQVNAVIYFRVADAAKAVIEVEDFIYATSQLAQTTMRNTIGAYTLDQLLQERTEVAGLIRETVDVASDPWGIDVQSVELKDIILPDSLKRTIAKVAEAERERKSVIIASEGEVASAENMAAAAATLNKAPGAMHLRTLAAINDLSSDQSNTTVWMVPMEVLRALEGFGKKNVS